MPSNAPVVVVDTVRSAVGRRNGTLAHTHAERDPRHGALGRSIERTGIDPNQVGQVVGGCVGQVGDQASNVTRQAWLTAGLPLEVPATTANVQCGSAQQSTTLAHGLVASGPRRRRDRVRGRGDEQGRDGVDDPARSRRRRTARGQVRRAVRADHPVRGRRPHRRRVGHRPRPARRVRAPLAAARRAGVGGGSLRRPDRPDRGDHRRRRRQPHGHGDVRPRRVHARVHARGPRRAAHEPAGATTRSTPRAPRRRSATAPPRCC